MTIVNPLASSNMVVQATATATRPEERQNDLRVEQIVRATVVEGGLDRAMLEMKNQRFLIQSEQELQTGQQLKLQVLTTHPKLSFKLLTIPLETRLAALMPLLAKPFNWHSLLQQIQQGTNTHSASMKQVIAQLATFLRPAADLPVRDLATIASTLERLKTSEPLFSGTNGPALAAAFDRLLSAINRQGDSFDLPQQLKAIALQIRQQPELMGELIGVGQEKVAGLLTQIDQPQKPLQPEQARQLATELKSLLLADPGKLPQFLSRATQDLQFFLNPSPENLELSPALLGHLKDLVGQLMLSVAAKPDWPQDLHQLVAQIIGSLQPVIAVPEILAQGSNLGLLSQLFGLNLETELLRGRTKAALSSLKLALLGERAELGVKGEEALHRLELFQICRVRLADQNLTFLPLPLPFLEEGFLLVEEHGEQNQPQKKEGDSIRLSLHLRLSSLGNLRIDMLSETSGTLMRVACEDQQRVKFLQSMSAELKERLPELNIRGISFTTGVETPARELLKKILPTAHGMLDARV